MSEFWNAIDALLLGTWRKIAKPSLHCAGDYEKKNCTRIKDPLKCKNCSHVQDSSKIPAHSATDASKCPLLSNKIKDKIALINYE